MLAAGGDAGAVAREGWRALEEPSVLRALDECLEGDPCDRDGLPTAGLPFVDEDWRDLAADALADESTPPWTALALLEAFDTRVRGRREIVAMLGVPPLAIIPWVTDEPDEDVRRRARRLFVGGLVGGAVVLLLLVHVLVKPLDVLWAILLRRLGG